MQKAKLAPIIFARIPLSACWVGMEEAEISSLVNRVYKDLKPAARSAHAGTLRRFLSEAGPGDLVGIRINRDSDILFVRFVGGEVRAFPGLEKQGIKGRPIELISDSALTEIQSASLPDSVKKYRGTFCNWLDNRTAREPEEEVDLPDQSEKQRRTYYTQREAAKRRQIKFIRVGADMGCGQRLSRIFPGDYYHFIPIPKHNDPEFCRYTYGDVAGKVDGRVATKGRSLMGLRQDDVLVLYAGFDSEGGGKPRRLVGIFAYLAVKEAFLFSRAAGYQKALRFSDQPRDFNPFGSFKACATANIFKEMQWRYENWNAHFYEGHNERMDVLICGRSKPQSKLLRKVEVLADFDPKKSNYIIQAPVAKKWGLTTGHDLKMSPVRTVDPEVVDTVFKKLCALV